MGNGDKTREMFDQALEIDSYQVINFMINDKQIDYLKELKNKLNAWDMFKIGKVFHEKRQYREALEMFNQAMEISPRRIINYLIDAKYLSYLKEFKDGLKSIDWFRIGKIYRARDQYNKEIFAYEKALEIDPFNFKAEDRLKSLISREKIIIR